jgi:hypothetical protein
MTHRHSALKKMSHSAKAIFVVMGLLVGSASVVNATSTGTLNFGYGTSGLFQEAAPTGANADVISIVNGPDLTTFHLIQYGYKRRP